MPVRKPAPTDQFDLFVAGPAVPKRSTPMPRPSEPANDIPSAALARRDATPAAFPAVQATDEWWTTRMTCAFLKISRKTLWERRRDQSLNFPEPVQLGGSRNLYRASAIRSWADKIAAAKEGGGLGV